MKKRSTGCRTIGRVGFHCLSTPFCVYTLLRSSQRRPGTVQDCQAPCSAGCSAGMACSVRCCTLKLRLFAGKRCAGLRLRCRFGSALHFGSALRFSRSKAGVHRTLWTSADHVPLARSTVQRPQYFLRASSQYFRSTARKETASMIWPGRISSDPSRSAIVRDTRRILQ